MTFSRADNFKKHLKLHSGEEPNKCISPAIFYEDTNENYCPKNVIVTLIEQKILEEINQEVLNKYFLVFLKSQTKSIFLLVSLYTRVTLRSS